MADHLVSVVVDGVRFRSPIVEGQALVLGSGTTADVHLPAATPVPTLTVHLADDWLTVLAGDDVVSGRAGAGPVLLDVQGVRVEARVVPACGRAVLALGGHDELAVGAQPGATVSVVDPAHALTARRVPGGWRLSVAGDDVLVANVRLAPGHHDLPDGEHIGLGAHDLVLLGDELHVDEALVSATTLPRRARSARTPPPGYPDVRRSPRLIHRAPEGTITVSAAPTAEDKRTGQLLKLVLPPLVMLGITLATAFLNGNLLVVLATGASAVATMALSVGGYVKDHRRTAADRATEEEHHRRHLVDRAVEIQAAADEQRRGALYHHPDVETLGELAAAHSPRVFEKTRTHADFLCYRLGLGTVDLSVTVEDGDRERTGTGTALQDTARRLCTDARTLTGMPIGADLMHGPVGYVGPRRLVVEQLQLLVDQIAFFHSYRDVQLVMVFPEQELEDWSWMRWYRHSSLREMNLRGFVHDQRSRDQVLSSLNQILTARRSALDEERGGGRTTFAPHYVVVLLDESLVMDHVVMALLRGDPQDLGCSVVVVQETLSGLTESVRTVVDIRDRDTGMLVLEQGELVNTPFAPDHHPDGFDRERLPRTIGTLHHQQDLRSSIPESVTFLELYEVERVEELRFAERWAQNSPHRTLGVPLGLRGAGDVVRLDLHEKAHGPHGLVAGTTGSGKSEIIQSYVLSLAVNFHPHDVAFLLIDYKGGGMANLFADLPHLLGTITNLDGAQSMRALVSIDAELERRQRVFAEHDVNHINQYQKLVRDGAAAEPMPHLFLVSDEFAELRSEQPEFMDELISTARIGRSLGIHLILATQKPSGVVNDQIWSNSKFKLALKVADRSDSMEIIKTPDAAEITLPGRAYLQVGNNEIYELFQSAWSGADYEPGTKDDHQEDHAIYAINDLGQYEILNPDLSGLDGAAEITQVPTQLEAVVAAVRQTALDEGVAPLPRPWLPPLPERIVVTDLHDTDRDEAWGGPKAPLRPVIGTVDIPSRQTQETLTLDLSRDGHLAVFGSPGYGKSTFLQTLVMDLARSHRPDHLHAYLLDLGTNGLLPLRGLPHVADTVTVDDPDKTDRLVARLRAEIRERKQLLSRYSVANLEMYERASRTTLPYLLLVVDGFEGLRGTPGEDAMSGLLCSVAREGAGLGVHLVLSAGRQASLRHHLTANIRTQVALKLNDDGEARTIVGRTSLDVDDLPGRGLIKLEQPEIFHTALPADGEDMLEIVEAIRAEAGAMDAQWSGPRPSRIPLLPEVLLLDDLRSAPGSDDLVSAGLIPVGLDCGSVLPVGLDPVQQRQVLVLAADPEVVGTALVGFWTLAGRAFPAGPFLFDDDAGHLRAVADAARDRATTASGPTPRVLDAALGELAARQEGFRLAAAGSGALSLAQYARTLPPALVLVADAAALASAVDAPGAGLLRLATEGPAYGMPIIAGGRLATAGKGYDEFTKAVRTFETGVVIGKLADQSILRAGNVGYKEPPLGAHEAYLVADATATRVKLPVAG